MYFSRSGFNVKETKKDAEVLILSRSIIITSPSLNVNLTLKLNNISHLKAFLTTNVFISSNIKARAFFYFLNDITFELESDVKSKTLFDAKPFLDYFISASLENRTEIKASILTDVLISSDINNKSYFETEAFKYLSSAYSKFESVADIYASAHFIIGASRAYFKTIAKATAWANVKEVGEISFDDILFNPGDIIEIDLCDFYINLNKVNIMDKFEGDFFQFYPGENMLLWFDEETERSVEIKIRYQNKYL